MITLTNRDVDDSSTFDDPADGPRDVHFGANDIGWQALGPALGCTLLATVVVAARWYSRCRIARCVGLDDYVILLSLVRRASTQSRSHDMAPSQRTPDHPIEANPRHSSSPGP